VAVLRVLDGATWRPRALVVASAATCLAISLAVGQPTPVRADVPFSGVASADGIRLSAAAPGFLLVEQFSDAGAPTAHATADSLQTASYAGYPWPGNETFGLLGTAGGATGMPLQDFPSAARSSSTGPTRSVKEYGPLRLEAQSSDAASSAAARAPLVTGPASAARTAADATVRHEASGTVVARATTQVEAFTVAGVLRIGGASAVAEVTAALGSARGRVSSLHLSDVTIAGQTVAITEKGLSVAGTSTPLPSDSPLAQLLEEQQVSVKYIRAENSRDGVVSAGVLITVVRAVPGLPEPVQGSYLLGRARAAATAGLDGAPAPATDPGPGVVATRPPVTTARQGSPVGAPVASVPVPDRGALPQVVAPPVTDPVAAPTTSREVVRTVAAMRVSGTWYLVLVLGGLIMMIGASLLRVFGVKALWP
jgi:hypothetical protein